MSPATDDDLAAAARTRALNARPAIERQFGAFTDDTTAEYREHTKRWVAARPELASLGDPRAIAAASTSAINAAADRATARLAVLGLHFNPAGDAGIAASNPRFGEFSGPVGPRPPREEPARAAWFTRNALWWDVYSEASDAFLAATAGDLITETDRELLAGRWTTFPAHIEQAEPTAAPAAPESPGYTVTLGGITFTQEQWETIDRYAAHRVATATSVLPDVGPVTSGTHPGDARPVLRVDGEVYSGENTAEWWHERAQQRLREAAQFLALAEHTEQQQRTTGQEG